MHYKPGHCDTTPRRRAINAVTQNVAFTAHGDPAEKKLTLMTRRDRNAEAAR
jgi:hypothetical protein